MYVRGQESCGACGSEEFAKRTENYNPGPCGKKIHRLLRGARERCGISWIN